MPVIEPFATLTEDHGTLETLADLFARNGDPVDLEAVRVTWEDHRAPEEALEGFARQLGFPEVLEDAGVEDARVERILAEAVPDAAALWGALRGHVEAWEFEVFPQLVLSADLEELDQAARSAAAARGSRCPSTATGS